jgi:hypothetical protein
MIKFFKKIGQNLLTENKIGKYLIYAIGEIALVMIGILLALQVNNWNEARHRRTEEISLLIGLRSDLRLKIEEMQKTYGYSNRLHERTTKFILSQLNHQDIKLDTREFLFLGDFYPIFNTHINSLEAALQGNTINLFRSDTLVYC